MHVRLIENRRTSKVRRGVVVTEQPQQPSSKPPPPPPPPPPTQPPPPPPPLCRSHLPPIGSNSLDVVAQEGILRIMEKVQVPTARRSRLPPLSARTQRLVLGRPGQPVQRVTNIPGGGGSGGRLFKGNASMRIRSARVTTCSPAYDMMVTGQTLTNGGRSYGSSSNGFLSSRLDDRTPSYIDSDQDIITTYLNGNRPFLDRYVANHVTEQDLEGWLNEKRSKRNTRFISIQTCEIPSTSDDDILTTKPKEGMADYRKFIRDLTTDVKHLSSIGKLMQHLASYVASATKCDDFTVYVLDEHSQEFRIYTEANNLNGSESGIEAENGFVRKISSTKDPFGLGSSQASSTAGGVVGLLDKPCNILSLPVLDLSDRVVGTIQFYRAVERPNFTEEDKRICSNLIGMSGLLLKCQEFYFDMGKQRQLNEFLLTVTKSIFQDIVSMDNVIIKIMNYAKRLVSADRTALFLLDRKTDEVYARVFDRGEAEQLEIQASSGTSSGPNKQSNEIRFSTNKGVAGYVAATGQTLNIADAYGDDRFNREIDLLTGYKTKTILCMPLCIRGKTIGVVQMVNKRNGVFTKRDEEAFEVFAVYCALALHHAKLYEKIRRSEQRNKVALEVLSYHSQATDEEANQLMKTPIPKEINELTDYSFSPWTVNNEDKPLYVLYMFRELFQQSRFDLGRLCRFTLTVRKNYRNVPYHNWSHAFSVAQCMFMIMKKSKTKFSLLEGLALFVACLCHDVDHRGFTNQFMVNSDSPLATLYSTSTMEHHHFNHTITILQQEGHNIFTYLSSDDYKQVLSDIKEFILATDLAIFFANKGRLKDMTAKQPFDWDIKEQRQLGFAISMTACDLCSSSKPWDIQIGVVDVIFEEFYAQGDKEKAAGKTPMTMMDRDRKEQLPILQSGFLTGICVPCYEILAEILPETQPMLEGTRTNLKRWQADAEKEKEKELAREKESAENAQRNGSAETVSA